MSASSDIQLLYQLARLYGVQTVYYDVSHHRQIASTEALLAMLQALGTPVASLQDVSSAWRERRQVLWRQPVEPVLVAWEGVLPSIRIRLPSSAANARLKCYLSLEQGEWQQWQFSGADLPLLEAAEIEGIQYLVKQLPLSVRLPLGYHRLTLELPGRSEETLIISAPVKSYAPRGDLKNRDWGVFMPLYALYRQSSWGSGDFSDMEALMCWAAEIGGRVVATLPLLPTFLGKTYDPSPYLPVSRLLWNEFYLDLTRVPELQECPSAQDLLASPTFKEELEALRSSRFVDYRRQMALKRQVLEELCHFCFSEPSTRLEAALRFAEKNAVVEDYARFQAANEKQHTPWRFWPQPLREGVLDEGDYDEENKRYHVYVQWLAQQQVQALTEKASGNGCQLYLDLPLGVHPDGYDVWRERSQFILDTSAGAPPDAVFTRGQNWEFPPLHPERIRQQGYRYTIAYLRHHLQHASILRIDHVMSLHRLFCIPKGLEAGHGVYIRYHADELYAILTLESYRNKAIVVGEDLGTVPPEVRPAMRRHNFHRMYVLHYELESNPLTPLRSPSRNSVASLNTHDMPPFASFWQGVDIKQGLNLGLLDKASARRERRTRQAKKKALVTHLREKDWLKGPVADTDAMRQACLAFLGSSRARILLVNLEDLWLETQPQNIPSTREEYPNWRNKARYSLEAFCQMPGVNNILREINRLRRVRLYVTT